MRMVRAARDSPDSVSFTTQRLGLGVGGESPRRVTPHMHAGAGARAARHRSQPQPHFLLRHDTCACARRRLCSLLTPSQTHASSGLRASSAASRGPRSACTHSNAHLQVRWWWWVTAAKQILGRLPSIWGSIKRPSLSRWSLSRRSLSRWSLSRCALAPICTVR